MKLFSKSALRFLSVVLSLMLVVSLFAVMPITANATGEDVYVLVGTIVDNGWEADISKNVMDKYVENCSITIPNVEAKPDSYYSVKVVKFVGGDENNAVWYGLNGSGLNVDFTVDPTCDVTVTFFYNTQEIRVDGEGVRDPVINIDYISAVGSGKDGFLNDTVWDPASSENIMTEDPEGVYEITYVGVKANQEYIVKFAANGSWDINWGGEQNAVFENGVEKTAAYNSSNNIIFTPESDTQKVTVNLRLDLRDWDAYDKSGAVYTITYNSEPDPAIVTFDAGEGYTPVEKESVSRNNALEFLPHPVRDGYTFAGWYLSGEEGGADSEQVYATVTEFYEDTVVYAHWVEAPGAMIKGFYFEEDDLEEAGWTFIDDDGDGNNWTQEISTDYMEDNMVADVRDTRAIPEGKGILGSYSTELVDNLTWAETSELNPKNWAISPAVKVPEGGATVSIWAKSATEVPENFTIYAGESANPEEMTAVSDVLTVNGIVAGESRFDNYTQYTADLSAFAGKTVHIAVLHHIYDQRDTANIWRPDAELLIDMMEVYAKGDSIKSYPLWIDDVQVNDINKADVLENGVFTYDSDSKTLSIKGNYTATDWCAVLSFVKGLTVDVVSDSEIITQANASCMTFLGDTTIKGKGELDVTAPANQAAIFIQNFKHFHNNSSEEDITLTIENMTLNANGKWGGIYSYSGNSSYSSQGEVFYGIKHTLKIINSNVTADCTSSRSAVEYFNGGIYLENCEVIAPDDSNFQNGDTTVLNGDGSKPKHVVIAKKSQTYDLWIKGVQVTDDNKSDVLGDGVFVYDSENNTLHVNGDCDAGSEHIIKSQIQNLTISVDGDSKLTSSENSAIWLEKDTTFTGDGELDVETTGPIGINVAGQADVTTTIKIDKATIRVEAQVWGIIGNNQNPCALEINDSEVTSTSNTPPNAALGDFRGGITLTGCEVLEPSDSTFQNGDYTIINHDGSNADHVVIGKKNADASETGRSEESSDAGRSEESSDAGRSEESSDAGTSEASSDASTSEASSDASTSEASSDAGTSESSGSGTSEASSDKNTSESSGSGTSEASSDKGTSESSGSGTSEASSDKGTSESSGSGTSESSAPGKSESSAPGKSESSSTEPKAGAETSAPTVKDGATEKTADKAITSAKTEKDAKGSKFGLLCLRQKNVAKNAIIIRWNKVKGAKYYVIYGAKCGKTKTGFTPFKKLKRVGAKTTTFTQKKLKKGTYYKYIVVALNSKKKVITTSKNIHIVTNGGTKGNDKTVKVNKSTVKLNLKKKKTFTIKATPVLQNKKRKVMRHRTIKFECTNTKVAKVTQKGKITAKKKGTCFIYVYAQNGLYKKVKVVVK